MWVQSAQIQSEGERVDIEYFRKYENNWEYSGNVHVARTSSRGLMGGWGHRGKFRMSGCWW